MGWLATMLGATLAATSLQLHADKPFLVAGEQGTATLEVQVNGVPDLSHASVTITSHIGTVGSVEQAAPGVFRATFTPPKARFPQVALIAARLDAAGEPPRLTWLALPIHGSATLDVKVERGAQVEVEIAGKVFGPVPVDPDGYGHLPAVVPPGQSTGIARSYFRKGGQPIEREFELGLPEFSRIRVVSAGPAAASWADGGLPLEIFTVGPDGAPAHEPVSLTCDRGTFTPLEQRGPGVWSSKVLVPDALGEGRVVVRGSLLGSPSSVSELEIPLRAGPVAQIELLASAEALSADGERQLTLQAVARDAKGNPVAERPALTADFGTLEPSDAGWTLRVPAAFEGRRQVAIDAALGEVRSRKTIALRPGPAATAELALDTNEVHAGDELGARLVVRDANGNFVAGLRPALSATAGQLRLDSEEPAAYRLRFATQGPPGRATLRASHGERLAARAEVMVLPPRRPLEIAAGVRIAGQTNFVRAHALTQAVQVGVRPERLPVELLADVGLAMFGDVTQPTGAAQGEKIAGLWSGWAMAGARYARPWKHGLSLHASGGAGLWRVAADLRIEGGPADGRTQSASVLAPGFFAGAGAAKRLGPGRAFGELQAVWAPGRAPLAGNFGGLALGVGYLFDVR